MSAPASLALDPTADPGADIPVAGGAAPPTGTAALRRALRPGAPARRFLLVSLALVLLGSGALAQVVGRLIESSALDRTTAITTLYVESFIEPLVQTLATAPHLSAADQAGLSRLLSETEMRREIVAFRIWSPSGEIVYSPDPALLGRTFPMDGDRGAALAGAVTGDISDLTDPENVDERARFDHLIEMYLPVRLAGTSRIIAVAEFYALPDALEAEVNRDRLVAWLVIGLAAVVALLAVTRVVIRASLLIERQEDALRRQLDELRRESARASRLDRRVRDAAARTIALNEQERRRISSDLHDGPSQALALALLRLDALDARTGSAGASERALPELRATLELALRDTRAIAADLRLPELEGLSAAEVLARVVRAHEAIAGRPVALELGDLPPDISPAARIALYRICGEALANARHHAAGAAVRLAASTNADGVIDLAITDDGPGFDAAAAVPDGHLGLAGMRERAELLGGAFELRSAPGAGTTVHVRIPAKGRP